MEKLLILTYYWPPSGGPGVQRWLKFAGYLKKAGYEPVIITVDPQQATYPLQDASLQEEIPHDLIVYQTPTREPYALYKKLTGRKQVPYSGFSNESGKGFVSVLSRFIRGNLFIPDARRGWNSFAVKKAGELISKNHIRIIITTGPPHSTHLAGLALKKKFPDLMWIADFRDLWTDIFYYAKMLHLPFVKALDRKLEKEVLLHADRIVSVSHFFRKNLLEKAGNNQDEKFTVIHNGYDAADFHDLYPAEQDSRQELKIVYTGTIGDDYDMSGFVAALEVFGKTRNFSLHFTGNIAQLWKEAFEEKFRERLFIYPHTNHKGAILQMLSADLLLLIIPRMEQNEGIVPAKVFEYMAAGKRILSLGPVEGDVPSILKNAKAGQQFNYDDATGILNFLLDDQQWEPDWNAIENFSREKLTEKLIRLF
jgi:glycosyltransferase involved in cell wall biosynthesis